MIARWAAYRLFEYEKELAIREARGLGARSITKRADGLDVVGVPATRLAERASYFSEIRSNRSRLVAQQALTERLHAAGAEGGRQQTRYGLHGVHEYKGKFNPQVVRALCNAADAEAKFLIDPFCGCGTSLIEGIRLGMGVLGIDRSPFATFLADTKVRCTLTARTNWLLGQVLRLRDQLAPRMKDAQDTEVAADLTAHLPSESIAYLRHWFTSPAFAAVSIALSRLLPGRGRMDARLLLVALSSVLRDVSMQVPEDLRIRRRPPGFSAPIVWERFSNSVEQIADSLREVSAWEVDRRWNRVCKGSAVDPIYYREMPPKGRRILITSPPYATALPYADTDRLSLIALGLAMPRQVRALEHELVGSREWNQTERRFWQDRSASNADRLPHAVIKLIRRIAKLNEAGTVGFRRKAVPDLLYRYFARMGEAMSAWEGVLRRGEFAILIIGRNATTAGNTPVSIRTPELTAEVAESRGFRVSEILKLETWPRYGIHHRNGVNGEEAVVLERVCDVTG